jgi:hypothetical protein
MAKTITPNIKAINEAGKLVLELMHPANYWRLRVDPTKCAEAPKELVRDVERLEVLLKKPNVGGALSLATPFPARIGFFWSVSYAQCVCDVFKSKLSGSCWGRDKFPEDNSEFLYHCIKELERVTRKPCSADFLETVKPRPGRHWKRNDWICQQYLAGTIPSKIVVKLKGKVPLYGKPISLTRVIRILKDAGIYKVELN